MTTLRQSFNGWHPSEKLGVLSASGLSRVPAFAGWVFLWLCLFVTIPLGDMRPGVPAKKPALQAATQFVHVKDQHESAKFAYARKAMKDGEVNFLLNLSNFEVLSLMGVPHFNRNDGNIRLWQYQQENCIIDVFLQDSQSKPGESTVVYFSVRPSHELEGVLPISYEGSNMLDTEKRNCLQGFIQTKK